MRLWTPVVGAIGYSSELRDTGQGGSYVVDGSAPWIIAPSLAARLSINKPVPICVHKSHLAQLAEALPSGSNVLGLNAGALSLKHF